MSLSVVLQIEHRIIENAEIWVRDESGSLRQLTRAEWRTHYPYWEPVILEKFNRSMTVFEWTGLTRNLTDMAKEAGLYLPVWRPEEAGIGRATQLIEPLAKGIADMKKRPDHYKQFNPPNGWGDYGGFVEFVETYLAACIQFPDATIRVSR